MATLVILKGPSLGREFALDPSSTLLGRQGDATVCLESQAVSRHHARILAENGGYVVEDLNSSNGTYVNGQRIGARTPLTEKDTLQVGPYLLRLCLTQPVTPSEPSLIVREQVNAHPSAQCLLTIDPGQKLQAVLEISQHLARTLDEEELLEKLLGHLLLLFPQADRGLVLLGEGDQLRVRAQRCRRAEDPTTYPFSRTIVRQALNEGIGVLSEDARLDDRFQSSNSLSSLDLHSLLCVPLISPEGRRLGALQLDTFQMSQPFRSEDLHLLTAVGLQVAVVLDNAFLHAELLREERLRQELALAREIQQGFLPTEFPDPTKGYELFARVDPAREVSGDLYDFFELNDQRLGFFVGDVSGKGMPAALFMVAVRTLGRHLGASGASPAETLTRLNSALAADNPSGMFVTLVHGIYQPATGEVVLASGGHPLPLVRRTNGVVEEVPLPSGRPLGFLLGKASHSDVRFTLQPGETLILYTDGFTEARSAIGKTMFDLDRFREALGGARGKIPLKACADSVRATVERFMGSNELQDDLTLFLLRRGEPNR